MKTNDSERRIRPAFIVVAVFALAVICVPLWLLNRQPPPPIPTEEAAPPVEASATVEPVVAASPAAAPVTARPSEPGQPGTLEGEWGIRVSGVSLAMSGAAVDFRYAVVDQDKALLLAQGVAEAYLIDQATGTKISLTPPPTKGPSSARSNAKMARQGGGFPPSPNRLANGRTNSLLLPNLTGIVKSGSVVTVVVGNIQAQNVLVQ